MSMLQLSLLILLVGFVLIGFILYLAYRVAEYKDRKVCEQLRVDNSSK